MRDIVYDLESYPNLFCVTFLDSKTQKTITYEISQWKDEWEKLVKFTNDCAGNFARWVGFNNFYFDYQVLHKLLNYNEFSTLSGAEKADFAYKVVQKIITFDKNEKFKHVVWANDHLVPQLDLYLIHHFNNKSRATSLKKMEFNMRSDSIQDLPFPIGTVLTREQADQVIKYNIHDCKETEKLRVVSADMIRFREELSKKYDRNFMNHNDTKIGKDYFIMELQNAGIDCFYKAGGERKPVQTKRDKIVINDIIFDYIKFERPEFNAVLGWLRKQVIKDTKGVFTQIENLGELERYSNLKKKKGKVENLNCVIDGFQFTFGTGGIHGSVDSTIVTAEGDFVILDYDVTSLYPSIAIVNNIYPKHLTEKFCEIYRTVKLQRMSYPKGAPENAMLKLALNGVYGDSNNVYSPFYDPQYTMTITINGQLMLCMLAEMLMGVEGLRLLQINTDGVTVKVRKDKVAEVEDLNRQWEEKTGLQLEKAEYSKMCIRDVNNYIAIKTDGELKRKGGYEYKREWHQNQSSLVVQKAVEAHLVEGKDIEKFIKGHDDPFDFMLRTNVPRSSSLVIERTEGDKMTVQQLQNVTRYYISTDGGQLVKIMPPLKGKVGERRIKINDKFRATPMNEMGEVKNINYNWYIGEARKLVDPLYKGAVGELLL